MDRSIVTRQKAAKGHRFRLYIQHSRRHFLFKQGFCAFEIVTSFMYNAPRAMEPRSCFSTQLMAMIISCTYSSLASAFSLVTFQNPRRAFFIKEGGNSGMGIFFGLTQNEMTLRFCACVPKVRHVWTVYILIFTACPPNSRRNAASNLSAKDSTCRERKRANNARVMIGAGTAFSIASSAAHRPSPESST